MFPIRDVQLGKATLRGGIFLSPMANFSDSPFRRICRELGCGLSYSEFVPADTIVRRQRKFMQMLRFHEEERPVILQIFGYNAETLGRAAEIVSELRPDAIDLNMGCSVREIVHKGSGAGLLRDPAKAGSIIESMIKGSNLTVTAKMRLGWDESTMNYLEVARVLQESGVSMISVHGRTKSQGYGGRANWNCIGEIKSRSSVPILGCGDVPSRADAIQKMKEFGVDGVLIGRAAMGNPWIFSDRIPSYQEKINVMRRHFDHMAEFSGRMAAILFRKHVARYLKKEDGETLREQLLNAEENSDVIRFLDSAVEYQLLKSAS